MVRSGFLITVVAETADAYKSRAEQLSYAVQASLAVPDPILGTDDCESAHIEIEVLPEDGAVVLRATIDCHAPKPVKFDKNNFTAEMRKHLDFSIKVTKRAIAPEEFPPYECQ